MNSQLLILLIICVVILFALIALLNEQSSQPKTSKPRPVSEPNFGPAYKFPAQAEAVVKAHINELPRAQVVYVLDGDTVIVLISRDRNTVRLDSIDCPEDGQSWGDIATAGLIKLIGGKTVHLEQHGQDPYGRTLATIYVHYGSEKGWINVNERMVMLGHAWVMRKYYDHLPHDRQQKLNSLERWAKSKKVGLWKEPNPIPPWRWRNSDENYPK
jgi:micrococcal nuclease